MSVMLRSRLFWGIAGALLAVYFVDRSRQGRRTVEFERAGKRIKSLAESGLAAVDSSLRAALRR